MRSSAHGRTVPTHALRATAFAVVLLAGCATTSAASQVEVVSAPPPGCRFLGDLEVDHPGFANGRDPTIDRETKRDAVAKLRERAAEKGATHLVVRSVDTYGPVLQDAKASGGTYDCPR